MQHKRRLAIAIALALATLTVLPTPTVAQSTDVTTEFSGASVPIEPSQLQGAQEEIDSVDISHLTPWLMALDDGGAAIVFSERRPSYAEVTVEAVPAGTMANMALLVAKSVDVDNTPTEVSSVALRRNPGRYHARYVRVTDATSLSRYRMDYQSLSQPATIGVYRDTAAIGTNGAEMLRQELSASESAVSQGGSYSGLSIASYPEVAGSNEVLVAGLNEGWGYSSRAETQGIVLTKGLAGIRRLTGLDDLSGGQNTLYLESDRSIGDQAIEVGDAGSYVGAEVSVTGEMYAGDISVKQVLSASCGGEQFAVPGGCVPAVVDVIQRVGVIRSDGEVLPVVASGNQEQGVPVRYVSGRYSVDGVIRDASSYGFDSRHDEVLIANSFDRMGGVSADPESVVEPYIDYWRRSLEGRAAGELSVEGSSRGEREESDSGGERREVAEPSSGNDEKLEETTYKDDTRSNRNLYTFMGLAAALSMVVGIIGVRFVDIE